jgi:predicted Zn-dependent protease
VDRLMLSDYLRRLGQDLGRNVRQANWLFQALTGTEAEVAAAEHAVGHDLAAAVLEQTPVFDDPGRKVWLETLGARLADRLKNKQRRFAFAVLDAGEPNAFALPGGYVFIERSLLDLCGWDADETAFVLGHEMAHVVRGNALDRLLASKALARLPLGGVARAAVSLLGLPFLTSAYSRDQEFEADNLGARLALAAGFTPDAGPRLLGRLAAADHTAPPAPLTAYFASHPPMPERIAALRRSAGK